ncbi:MAG: guanylate kinase [Pseudomonadota bacterium]
MNSGKLYIISAPSGAGKTSLLAQLIATLPNIEISVSHTTRAPREGEVDGKHYHFISETQFKEKIEHHAFIEHANVFDNFYGTSSTSVEGKTRLGVDVILEIDWQGAQQVREKYSDAVSIFILPPSINTLNRRLRKRAQDDEQTIQKRLSKAQQEIAHFKNYDYVVINDDFDVALSELKAIFVSNRLHVSRFQLEKNDLINELLSIP